MLGGPSRAAADDDEVPLGGGRGLAERAAALADTTLGCFGKEDAHPRGHRRWVIIVPIFFFTLSFLFKIYNVPTPEIPENVCEYVQ